MINTLTRRSTRHAEDLTSYVATKVTGSLSAGVLGGAVALCEVG